MKGSIGIVNPGNTLLTLRMELSVTELKYLCEGLNDVKNGPCQELFNFLRNAISEAEEHYKILVELK